MLHCNNIIKVHVLSAKCNMLLSLRQVGLLCKDMLCIERTDVLVVCIQSAHDVWRALGHPTPGLLGLANNVYSCGADVGY